MLLQTCKTFVHLKNTGYDIFNEIRELFEPDSNATQIVFWGPMKLLRVWNDMGVSD